jgi:teichuronic acid biosynthesis glycosyltransferase TuaC
MTEFGVNQSFLRTGCALWEKDLRSGMHVLTLTPFYPTTEDNASGCFIAEAVGELERQGVQSSVIAAYPVYRRHSAPDRNAPPAVAQKYFCFPGNAGLSSAGYFLYAAVKSRVRQLHQECPVGVIHAHAALPCGQAAMLLSRDLGIPFVVTVHGLDAFYMHQVSGWMGRRCADAAKEIYAAAARVISISERVAQPIRQELGKKANITVVYNSVDSSLFVPANGAEPQSPVILSIGNLIPTKGHELLLRAIAAITPAHAHASCRIIGDGPERKRLQKLAGDLGIRERVHFLGRRPRAAVVQAMKECTLFALPSSYEGLGCVYLEAMSAARPAIGCRGQGIEEVIRHTENGWLIQPHDVDDLTAALQELLSDRGLCERIGRNGRATILQGFTLAHQAKQLASIYQESLR